MSYAAIMKLSLTVLLFMVFSIAVAETVYKTVDEDGNVIFSDQPSDGAEQIELQELQTIKNPNTPRLPPRNTAAQAPDPAEYYQAISIISPAEGEGYRNNAGNLNVRLSLQPALKPGHKFVIKLDGEEIASGTALSATVENVDRGTHSLSAAVVDTGGNSLISTTSSFSMLRVSLGTP